jgi:hypothetical protein
LYHHKLQARVLQLEFYDSTMIAFLDLVTHLRLVNLIATSGKIFFALAGLSNCHWLDLDSTLPSVLALLLHYAGANTSYEVSYRTNFFIVIKIYNNFDFARDINYCRVFPCYTKRIKCPHAVEVFGISRRCRDYQTELHFQARSLQKLLLSQPLFQDYLRV